MSERVLQGAIWFALCTVAIVSAIVMTPFIPQAHAGNWTGCYVGAGGGYTTATTDTKISQGPFAIDVDSLGYAGGSYSALGGCDLQVNAKVVLGAWAEWTKADANFDVTVTGAPGSIVHTGLDTSWAVGGRAGYLIAPNALLYALAGYTQADTKDVSFPAFGPGTPALSVPTLDGYVIGAGSEFSLGNGFFLQAVYEFARYDGANIPLGAGVGAPVLSLDSDVQTARLGLTYKLNFDPPKAVKDVVPYTPPPLK